MPDVPIRKDSAWRKKFELEFASPDSGRESVTFDAEMERVHRQGLELQTSIETYGNLNLFLYTEPWDVY